MNITGGKFKGRKIRTLKTNEVRPTSAKVRESLFSMLNSLEMSLQGKVFLDLFAGSGIMGVEALSRGAEKSIFVEKNYKVYSQLKLNLNSFDSNYDIHKADALRYLSSKEDKYDLIFIDPPYYEGFYDKILPIAELKLVKSGLIIVEAPIEYKLPEKYNILKHKIYGDTQIFIFS